MYIQLKKGLLWCRNKLKRSRLLQESLKIRSFALSVHSETLHFFSALNLSLARLLKQPTSNDHRHSSPSRKSRWKRDSYTPYPQPNDELVAVTGREKQNRQRLIPNLHSQMVLPQELCLQLLFPILATVTEDSELLCSTTIFADNKIPPKLFVLVHKFKMR